MRRRLVDLVLAVILVLGLFLGSSTPRSAETAIPTAPSPGSSWAVVSDNASGNLSPQSEAPSVASLSPSRSPRPTTVIGTVLVAGRASWYSTGGPGLYAALPGYPDSPHRVRVCAGSRCIVLRVVTSCICLGPPRKIIDLSLAAFRRLAPPSRGIVFVTVEVLR